MSGDPTPDLRAMSNEALFDLMMSEHAERLIDGNHDDNRCDECIAEFARRLGQRDRLLAALGLNPQYAALRSLVAECKEGQ